MKTLIFTSKILAKAFIERLTEKNESRFILSQFQGLKYLFGFHFYIKQHFKLVR